MRRDSCLPEPWLVLCLVRLHDIARTPSGSVARGLAELGIEFVSPFTLRDGGDTLSYVGLVSRFGSKRGTAIILKSDLATAGRFRCASSAPLAPALRAGQMTDVRVV